MKSMYVSLRNVDTKKPIKTSTQTTLLTCSEMIMRAESGTGSERAADFF